MSQFRILQYLIMLCCLVWKKRCIAILYCNDQIPWVCLFAHLFVQFFEYCAVLVCLSTLVQCARGMFLYSLHTVCLMGMDTGCLDVLGKTPYSDMFLGILNVIMFDVVRIYTHTGEGGMGGGALGTSKSVVMSTVEIGTCWQLCIYRSLFLDISNHVAHRIVLNPFTCLFVSSNNS